MTARGPAVLHVVSALGMGGAETWLMHVLRHAARTGGMRMDFLATSGRRGVFDEEAVRLGARVHYVPYTRATLPAFTRAFRRLLAEGRYDAIHDHTDYASGWHFALGAGALPPIRVTHVHSAWLHIEANYGVTPLRRLTARAGRMLVGRFATDVCGTSAHVLDMYGFRSGAGRPRVQVLHCGLDPDAFGPGDPGHRAGVLREFGWADDAKVVLFAGRLDRALTFDDARNLKNSWFALNVVREAMARDASVRFLMAGADDGVRDAILDRVRAWGLDGRIRLLGVRHDVPRLMRASDVLLFPSRQEGLGMAAVEAQAAGLPVLASTAVPRECVVVPELFSAMPLEASMSRWADALLERITALRPPAESARRAVAASAFSIEESSRRLAALYGRARG